jgi:hypothetical protein
MQHIRGLIVGMLLAAAAPLVAQESRPQPQPRPDAEQRVQSPQRLPIGFLLRHRAEIGLSDQQITRLEGIAALLEQQNKPLLDQLRSAGIPIRPERRDGVRQMTEEERRQLRVRLEEHRPTLLQMRENMSAAMTEVRSVLTREQQQRVRELMPRPAADARRDGRRSDPPRRATPKPPNGN